MANKPTIKGQIVIEYLKKVNENQHNWKRGLAKKIFEKHPNLFSSIDNARTMIRRHTGESGERSRINKNKHTQNHSAKILILDIETAPMEAYVWGIWEQNINYDSIKSHWFILTWSAKWLFDKKVYSDKLTSKEAISENDKRIMKSLWSLLDEADIVIAHNGDKFDIPKINTRFLYHDIHPPMPYLTIDTLKHLRKFSLPSNKLDNANKYLSLTPKKDNEGMPLWIKCRKGDEKALRDMELYNIQDVRSLEETYLRIRPWIKPHPNVGLHVAENILVCPTCGHDELREEGTYQTQASIFKALRCTSCGAVSRQRKQLKSNRNPLSTNK